MRKKLIRFLWITMASVVLLIAVAFIAIWNGWIGYMPDMEELENPISRSASMVFSADGKLMGTYNSDRENRIIVDYNKLSPDLVRALVATEDERFYDHSGIDFKALGRAIVKRGIMGQTSAGGGSTITQQLAKQLFTEKAHSTLERLIQKPIEWVIAIKLERNFTKEEIIAMYLNYFDFLHNAVGIKMAADTYFSKEPKELTLAESATLIGMCKNPSYFNPYRYEERCVERRNVVLSQMLNARYISRADYDSARVQPLGLNIRRRTHQEGVAMYFREFIKQYMMAEEPDIKNYPSWNRNQYLIDSVAWANDPLFGWCHKNKKRNGEDYNIYTDGLRIYSTIDTRMQRYAEEAVYQHVVKELQPQFNAEMRMKANAPFSRYLTKKEAQDIMDRSMRRSERYRVLKENGASDEDIRHSFNTKTEMTIFTYRGERDTTMTPMDSIRYYKKFLRSGFVSMEAHTGHVKAYVGGLDYEHFSYDMAFMGRRQVGSTTKPYLYALTMENGMNPCDQVLYVQKNYGGWIPKNGSRARYGSMVPLKWGLAQSNNWISAQLMSRINPQDFINILHKFGINTPGIEPSMVLCLGPNEVSVGEMVSAYTTFANHGIHCAPIFVTRIEDYEGNVLAEFQPRLNEVISESSANKMLVMLKGVIDGGTGSRMRYRYNVRCEMGGKTGTTNLNADAWFMGFTPSLVNGCWVGGEDRDIHFDSTSIGQGANMALPIWAYYMQRIFADKSLGYSPDEKFEMPSGFDPCASDEDRFGLNGIEEVYE